MPVLQNEGTVRKTSEKVRRETSESMQRLKSINIGFVLGQFLYFFHIFTASIVRKLTKLNQYFGKEKQKWRTM